MNFLVGDEVEVDWLFGTFKIKWMDKTINEAIITDGTYSHTVKLTQLRPAIANITLGTVNQLPSQVTGSSWSTYVAPVSGFYGNNGVSPFYNAGEKIELKIFDTALCECGSHKTYGENCSPDFHSTWCSLYRKV